MKTQILNVNMLGIKKRKIYTNFWVNVEKCYGCRNDSDATAKVKSNESKLSHCL